MSDEMLLEDDPAHYWEMMFKKLARENSRLMERLVKLEDLLRWRDAWGEPPTEHGEYLVQRYEFYGGAELMTLHWNGNWPLRAISHWRPIGPLPGGDR